MRESSHKINNNTQGPGRHVSLNNDFNSCKQYT